MIRSLAFALIAILTAMPANRIYAADDTVRAYVGSYADAQSDGIHVLELDRRSGKLSKVGGASGVKNPSFVALHPNQRFLYSVCEVSQINGQRAGAIAAFAIDGQDGRLKLLNRESSGGQGPCHLVVDRAGKNVLAANYGGGSVCCLPIDREGRLAKASAFVQHHGKSVHPQRQTAPHAHSINLDRANRFAFVADLGLDKVLVYRFDADKGTLQPNDPPAAEVKPGAGPRHFAFHPSGRFAYVINELASTITAFSYDDAKGVLTVLQTLSTLPEGFEGDNTTAEVQVHPSGKFVYGSNRGHNSIAAFTVDAKTGRLTLIGHQSSGGKIPRNFAIDPSGSYLLAANQDSGNIVVLAVDADSGKLSSTGNEIKIPKPVCVKFAAPPDSSRR